MVPWGWLSFRVVDCPWHCGPFSSLGHQVLLDEWSLLQPGVAGLHLQPWVEDPTPATYSSSLWVSSTSPGMDMVGRALRSTCRSCVRSAVEFLLRGTCNGTGHEVAMLCRETAWWLSALYSESNMMTQGRELSASTEKWKTLISLLESWEVSFLLVHRRMWQRHNMHLQGTMQASVPLITVDENMIPPCPCPSYCSRLGDEKLLPWYATEAGAVRYKETTLSACLKASSSNPVAQ